MSHSIETTIYYRGLFPFDELFNIMESKGTKLDNIEIFTIDNWEYDNKITYKCDYREFDYNQQLVNNKILFLSFLINGIHSGIHAYMVGDNTIELCLWLRSEENGYLDVDIFNDVNHEIYDEITNTILQSSFGNSIILVAVGFETMIQYDAEIQAIIDSGAFIVRWIIPNIYTVHMADVYKVKKLKEFDVYYLT